MSIENIKALIKPIEALMEEARIDVLHQTKSKKFSFTFEDAVKYSECGCERTRTIIKAVIFLQRNPLKENDYFKFVNAYAENQIKLSDKYFRHDLEKLNNYYRKVDEQQGFNPFSKANYESYVLFMFLKLYGNYKIEDDELFNVQFKDDREYNPLTKIPSVLRGSLPFDVKEYDIKRAFPTFIDIELNSEYRHNVYELLSKSEYSMYLNSNNESKVTIDEARKGLSTIYKKRVNEVLTDERYNEKGRLFKDLTSYEKKYIDMFISENNLTNYVRLHDGIFVLKNVECKSLVFDTVEFSIKESIKPKTENNTVSFYDWDDKGQVVTTPSMYSDFLSQENFIRIKSKDDKIQLLQNTNNVVDFFNHKTSMVTFLDKEINETCKDAVRDKIARDNNKDLAQSYTLLKEVSLEYYKDSKDRFGLPFKNGFFYFDNIDDFEIKSKPYDEVKGFFTPHQIQGREFNYTSEIGNFEKLIFRVATGEKYIDVTNEQHVINLDAFTSMIGYLVHNYKPHDESPCIVLTDEGADDETRNGRRCKTIVVKGLEEVTKVMMKGGDEFNPKYDFCYNDLDKSYNIFVVDDAPAGFDYNALYTPITGGINAQKKGGKAEMIEREDSPKFMVTTNFLFRCDERNASTVARFYEYKFKPYYSIERTPRCEFNQTLFEDWDAIEWNKFYSFIFRCVNHYMKNGLHRIPYDKTEDNFNAEFGSDVRLSEMERIITILSHTRTEFNVSDFLTQYHDLHNPLRFEKLFTTHNTRRLIDLFFTKHPEYGFVYGRGRKWVKERIEQEVLHL